MCFGCGQYSYLVYGHLTGDLIHVTAYIYIYKVHTIERSDG